MVNRVIMKYSFILNFIMVALHEMDAIFWHEWRLFGITNDAIGRNAFILAHLPLYCIIILSINTSETLFGKVTSLIFSSFLIAHFFLHYNALAEKYFNAPFSFAIITGILILSLIQVSCTILTFKSK
jgi:hypothetical protein